MTVNQNQDAAPGAAPKVSDSSAERRLFAGLTSGFVFSGTLVLATSFVESEWLYWLGCFGSFLGGGASLLTAFVVFGRHLTHTRASAFVTTTGQAQDDASAVSGALRAHLATKPFWAGLLGSYALGSAITSQLVSVSAETVMNEVPPAASLVGVLAGAIVLVLLDAQTAPWTALLLVVALALISAGAFYLFEGQERRGYSVLAVAGSILVGTGLVRWRGRRTP
ncbi:hypothetical protein [Nocardioides terrigena]|uniref:hypothetical protein n=1 Tax=Nocardioides terrigena TaxID=424797 RepID=UPI00131EF1F4|nr:hypothetical protein [Nocardioides terrigena]